MNHAHDDLRTEYRERLTLGVPLKRGIGHEIKADRSPGHGNLSRTVCEDLIVQSQLSIL
jgi:hypothetical protein